jgi:MFS family permease
MATDKQIEDATEELDEQAAIASSSAGSPLRQAPVADASPATEEKPPENLPPIWRNRDYMLLWSGQVVSVLGSGIAGLAFPLLVLFLTNNDYAAAGFIAAVSGLPYLLFSLPVGALIDRWDRKRVMILCDIGRAINVATIPLALYFNVLTVWQLYINAFIEGSLFVFFNIAEVAALSRVVKKVQLPQASAQNEAGYIAANIVAPQLGGILFGLSRIIPFVVDAISYFFSFISLLFIKTVFQEERKVEERNLRREIAEGIRWLWHHKLIRFMAFLTGGSNFASAGLGLIVIVLAQNLLGITGTEVQEMGPELGTIFTIGSIGGVFGALIGGRLQKRFTFGQVIIAVMWVQALLFPLFVFAPNIIIIGIIAALTFMTAPIYNVVQFSYRLALIPDHLQGRVNSAFRMLAFGFQPIGSALAGLMLKYAGVTTTVIVYTVVLGLLALATTLNSHVRNAKPIEQVVAAG